MTDSFIERKTSEFYSNKDLKQTFIGKAHAFRMEYWWPLALQYSFLTLLYFTIEERLRYLCKLIQKENLSTQQRQIGKTLQDYMEFLESIEDLLISRENLSNWQKITDLAKIRNCIVHAFGRIEECKHKKHLQNLIAKETGLNLVEETGQLMASEHYCREAVGTALQFFQEVKSHLYSL
ncbi:MAG: hypothetical protein GXO56_00105 [Chloroflexi bacterium]|nr:hypothetical protein [Chloroflexota bacterium]